MLDGGPASYNHVLAMITVSKEDYLKAIFEAESEGEAVISATLANWLEPSNRGQRVRRILMFFGWQLWKRHENSVMRGM